MQWYVWLIIIIIWYFYVSVNGIHVSIFQFKLFIYIPFMFQWTRMCNLVLISMFIWVSAGPTCSVLSLNAKDISGCVCFRGELLFSLVFIHLCFMNRCCHVLSGSICACWVFLLNPCFHLDFRYQMIAACMGIGSSTIFVRITGVSDPRGGGGE